MNVVSFGGGTKTDAVLCDGEGRVISRFIGGASGFTGIPREEAEALLKKKEKDKNNLK